MILPPQKEAFVSEFDLVIIGAGTGGYVCAIRAAQLGQRVALVEKDRVGGVCLNWGCIPTKTLIASAEAYLQAQELASLGIQGADSLAVDWPTMLARKDGVVETLVNGVVELLAGYGVELIHGHAQILRAAQPAGPKTVAIALTAGGQRTLETSNIVIATGSVSARPPIAGLDADSVVTSRGMLSLDAIPRQLVVIGGGVIGIEFAALFSALGAQVTVLEMLPYILPPVDREFAKRHRISLRQQGIDVQVNAQVQEVDRAGQDLVVRYTLKDRPQSVAADLVLNATGRVPFSDRLGLDEAGIQCQRGRIPVNSRLETNVPGVYAIGDVTGEVLLAHVASRQGEVAAEVIAGQDSQIDYRAVPNVVFSRPEIAGVGLTSQEAKEQGIDLEVGAFPFTASGKALAMGHTEGQARLLCEPGTGKILGMHVMGPGASDLIAEGALAVQMGLMARDLAETIHAHPTLPEAVAEAAREAAFGAAIHYRRLGRRG
jgi:dihydrolipoamide dehydrogenase